MAGDSSAPPSRVRCCKGRSQARVVKLSLALRTARLTSVDIEKSAGKRGDEGVSHAMHLKEIHVIRPPHFNSLNTIPRCPGNRRRGCQKRPGSNHIRAQKPPGVTYLATALCKGSATISH